MKSETFSPSQLQKTKDPFDELLALVEQWNRDLVLVSGLGAPYCWAVNGVNTLFRGEFAQLDAEAEAARCGGSAQAFPLFRVNKL